MFPEMRFREVITPSRNGAPTLGRSCPFDPPLLAFPAPVVTAAHAPPPLPPLSLTLSLSLSLNVKDP